MLIANYHGGGTEFIQGIPARDLDDTDWHNLSEEARAYVKSDRLYTLIPNSLSDADLGLAPEPEPEPDAEPEPKSKK